MFERRSLKLPITLGVTMIVLLVLVIVGWVLLAVFGALRAAEHAPLYWTLLSVGTIVLTLILAGVIAYLVMSIRAINLNRRQSNFLDSVTHELKSPIASLKLSLQTMNRHPVSPEQAATFHKFMLEDLERLDHLITHLLAAGQMAKKDTLGDNSTFDLQTLLQQVALVASQRYGIDPGCIQSDTEACWVTTKMVDVELIVRNIVDNALKYGGNPPEVEIWLRANVNGKILLSVGDNGRGIPADMRRKIFQRFVRLGSELTREKSGTGLGLYIVRTLVRRLGGQISVHDCETGVGTQFQIELPGKLRAEQISSTISCDPTETPESKTSDGNTE
ncbi:MAG: HAMP domain-containing histidine kinase [Planctomycetales bacterium]|nr:HAMP domain-containing histidine kinase [Planctomycetales bacterium]